MKKLIILVVCTVAYFCVDAQKQPSKKEHVHLAKANPHVKEAIAATRKLEEAHLYETQQAHLYGKQQQEIEGISDKQPDRVKNHKTLSFGVKASAALSFISQGRGADSKAFYTIDPGASYNAGAVVEFRPLKRWGLELNALYSPFRIGVRHEGDSYTDEKAQRHVVARYVNLPVMVNFYMGRSQKVFLSAGYQRSFLLSVKDHNGAMQKITGQVEPTKAQMKEAFSDYNSVMLGFGGKSNKYLSMGMYATLGLSDMLNRDNPLVTGKTKVIGYTFNGFIAVKF